MFRFWIPVLIATLSWGCASSRPKYKAGLENDLKNAPAAAEDRESPYRERRPLHPVTEAVVESAAAQEARARVGAGPLSLQDCIAIATQNSRTRPVSRLSLKIAEAQLRQALSFYWPEVTFKSTYTVQETDPHSVTQEQDEELTVSGLAPMPVTLDVTIPEQTTILADRKTWENRLEATWPLFTGGRRSAVVRQARFGVEAALEEVRQSDLQLLENVERFYYSAVLSQRIVDVIHDALLRMEVTLDLTERLYQGGSLEVDKTDYLRMKVFVEGLRATLARLEPGARIARAALIQTMGLPWETEVELAAEEIPFDPYDVELEDLVANTYVFNPDWNRIRAALQAAEAKIKEARSGHFPTVAVFGQLIDISNDLDTGVMTPDLKETWAVGVGMELPLFRGFRTVNEVREARARMEKVKNQGILLREGLALQIKQLLYTMIGVRDQVEASRIAARTATENRELHLRAYQDQLVETEDVIESQLIEVVVKVAYEQARFAHREQQLLLNSTVGRAVERLLEPEAASPPAGGSAPDPSITLSDTRSVLE